MIEPSEAAKESGLLYRKLFFVYIYSIYDGYDEEEEAEATIKQQIPFKLLPFFFEPFRSDRRILKI